MCPNSKCSELKSTLSKATSTCVYEKLMMIANLH